MDTVFFIILTELYKRPGGVIILILENMRKSLISIILLLCTFIAEGQNPIKISKPDVTYLDGILTVRYDIAGCGSGEFVDIRLVVLNSRGDTLRPTFITGDLGSRVNCGFGKKIEWNMKRDGVLIDEDIDVLVTGKPLVPDLPSNIQPVAKQLSRGNVILSSVFVPGLGQKKASGKGSHLIFSGLVYGALGTSVLYNLKSNKYYSDYQDASGTARDELFAKSENAFNMSQYMLYAGAGAWVVNFIWSATIPIRQQTGKKMSVNVITEPGAGYLVSSKWTF